MRKGISSELIPFSLFYNLFSLKHYIYKKQQTLQFYIYDYDKAILVPKKSDSKLLKKKKEIVHELFFSSIKSIYIDEIQDLDENGFEILDFLFSSDVNLYCVGDFR